MLRKAVDAGADEVVADLEDAVAPTAKDEAREGLLLFLGLHRPEASATSLAVRVNPPGSRWCNREIELLAGADALTSIVLPKVESAGDIAFADRLLAGAEALAPRERPLRLQALIETAAGLARIDEIAAASPRLDSLILGYADLSSSLGHLGQVPAEADAWRGPQERLLLAARANGLQAIDGPYFELGDEEGLASFATATARAGFDGKWGIHPAQLGMITAAFTPGPEETEWARKVLQALSVAGRGGDVGAVALEGKMVDEAMASAARRLLRRAGVDA